MYGRKEVSEVVFEAIGTGKCDYADETAWQSRKFFVSLRPIKREHLHAMP